MRRSIALSLVLAVTAGVLPIAANVALAQTEGTPLEVARDTEPVVLTGASFPSWAVPADVTAKVPGTGGKSCPEEVEGIPNPIGDGNCTNNTYEDPEVQSSDATNAAGVAGAPVDRLLGFRWDAASSSFEQVPFQVDEMAVRYLSNNNSGFAFYSETDQHTTYVFDREGFRWTADYGSDKPNDPLAPCTAKPASEVAQDPVVGLDTDDELVFMAKDAGPQAAVDAPLPAGITDSYEVSVADPLTGAVSFLYVMQSSATGPEAAFDETNGYVRYQRDDPEDGNMFLFSESSYENYGAAPEGAWYDPATGICHSAEDQWRQRRPSDAATISTPRYRFRYDGRWLMTQLRVNGTDDGNSADLPSEYGPDLIDQWKARAFQQRPGGETPCCGYEEEVNNWGGSSILMGELSGPVRTIRETWGADSGTNVVRREIFYRDEIRFGSYLRVHVIPPADGIYAQWDYNAGIVDTYYNSILTAQGRDEGVPIDGQDDEVFGNSRMHVSQEGIRFEDPGVQGGEPIVVGEPSDRCPNDACINNDIDSPDPTFSGANAGLNWEEVAGEFGTVVTRTAIKQITPGGTAQSVLAVPYYRDDSCFDDGTGSNPGPHLDSRSVDDGEDAKTEDGQDRVCWTPADGAPPPEGDRTFWQGSIGTHGVHILAIADSDNASSTVPLTEIDGEQRVVVLPGNPGNVGDTYGRHSEKPLVVAARPEARATSDEPSPSPTPTEPEPSPTPTATETTSPNPSPTPSSTPTATPSVTPTPTPTAGDHDGDGVPDSTDNCPNDPNPNQENTYGTARGDACEARDPGNGGGGNQPGTGPSNRPAAEAGNATPTIAATDSQSRAGAPFTLNGTVSTTRGCGSDLIVDLRRRVYGTDSFETIASLDVAADRTWTFTGRAERSASYIAVVRSSPNCTGQSSSPLELLVKARIDLDALPSRCRGIITGRLLPASSGKILLERRAKRGWTKISTGRVDQAGRFALRSRSCGSLRLKWEGDTSSLGTSKRFKLRG